MVSHVVLMTPRADLSATDRRAFVDAFERALRGIPTVRSVRISPESAPTIGQLSRRRVRHRR